MTQEFDKICSIVPMATSDVDAYHLFDYTTVLQHVDAEVQLDLLNVYTEPTDVCTPQLDL